MLQKQKYPRTMYLPYSGSVADDGRISETDFIGENVVITVKRDGENTSMSNQYTHARSLDSQNHPSRDYVKGLWGRIAHMIPEGLIITGENLYAQHTIKYNELTSYFQVFGLWSEDYCYDWEMTKFVAEELGLEMVPTLFEGILTQEVLDRLISWVNWSNEEGFVVRIAEGFSRNDFCENVAKYVKPQFKQAVDSSTKHWMHTKITPNRLAND